MQRVAVIGASRKPERYAHRALQELSRHGFAPVPVSRLGGEILGLAGYASLAAVPEPVDTVTVYLAPERQEPVIREILAAAPRRVIFNPGAENPAAYPALTERGIQVLEACTLVLLATGQF